jgi:hypothetical protein
MPEEKRFIQKILEHVKQHADAPLEALMTFIQEQKFIVDFDVTEQQRKGTEYKEPVEYNIKKDAAYFYNKNKEALLVAVMSEGDIYTVKIFDYKNEKMFTLFKNPGEKPVCDRRLQNIPSDHLEGNPKGNLTYTYGFDFTL